MSPRFDGSSDAGGADSGTRTGAVDLALLHLAYGRLRASLVLTVLVVALCLSLFLPYFAPGGLVAWGIALGSVVACRSLDVLHYLRFGIVAGNESRHHFRLTLGAAAAGLSWAFGPATLIVAPGQGAALLLVLVLLTANAVSMATLSPHLRAMWAFQTAALVPTALALSLAGGEIDRLVSFGVLLSLIVFMLVGRASNRTVRTLVETELRLAASLDTADEARRAAESASNAKSRFLANMSHELRTPLNAVIGAAQLLRHDDHDQSRRVRLLETIERSGATLLSLIDSILDQSRIEAGMVVLERREFPLPECIDSALVTATLAARAQGLRLAAVIDPDLAPVRRGDEKHLRQVLINLLGNAVKFTPRGDIVVRAARAGTEDVRFEIADTGIGIDPSSLPRVFEPFRQGDEGADRRYGGSGLGLAIVRQIVEAMGGRIDVESAPGAGSRFVVVVPLPAVGERPTVLPRSTRACYYEPHEPSAEALEALLLTAGYATHRCTTPDALLVSGAPAAPLLLVDADSPAGSEWLRRRPAPLPSTVVAMTDADTHAGHGDIGWIIRPVTATTLSRALSTTPPAVPDAQRVSVDAPRIDAARVLIVEDDAFNRLVVEGFLQHGGHRVQSVADGATALATLRAQAFDLVLMDWQMPGLDGLATTRKIRDGDAGESSRDVPIIALTANAFSEDRDACLRAGMDDFLSKPVDANRLLDTVARWSGGGRGRAHASVVRIVAPIAPAAARTPERTARGAGLHDQPDAGPAPARASIR